MPLVPELGFIPDLDAIDADTAAAPSCCSSTTRTTRPARRPGRLLRGAGRVRRRQRHPDRPRQRLLGDDLRWLRRALVPGDTGSQDVGVEVFSLSKGYNMTGWRCAAIVGNADALASYWRLKTNVDSGLFEVVQLAGAAALAPRWTATRTR